MASLDLAELANMERAATPGPWYVRAMDDDFAMCATATATKPNESGDSDDLTDCPAHGIIAATLIQLPEYVVPINGRSIGNAELIAAVRNALPALLRLAEIGAAAEGA
ncbi:hypothetical protein [Sphingomonas oligophenolica]|uniref:Uncharacterized protein n=1 Tax=Sphingomonas oligophenolica TaxID=301154 RepID=A0A502CPE0_9SPHN|nr:hypothetical protein [Sphingomonas oligophenolica]TPG15505.1 hypothetical protein EAH84_01500 [Sphingomonas oligophenolica]